MSDRFFLLAGLQIEIDATIVILAEFRCKRRQQLAKRLTVPGHQFRKQERRNCGVPLGDVQTGADAAAFFAANQNVLFEHQLANVLESNRRLMELSPELCGELVNQLGNGECLCDVSRQFASSREMPDEQRKNLMGVDERAVAVNGADAVAISIGAQASVVFSGKHGLPQRFDVRLNRFGMDAAEARITRPANFIANNSIAPEEFR